MNEFNFLDFAHILLLFMTCVACYVSGKSKGASEMCEMLLNERIIKNSDLDKLKRKYRE
tara:strand:+ start:1126 stop:1302 length:177 start_codon:yes stop_codon:yes gene_type:complete